MPPAAEAPPTRLGAELVERRARPLELLGGAALLAARRRRRPPSLGVLLAGALEPLVGPGRRAVGLRGLELGARLRGLRLAHGAPGRREPLAAVRRLRLPPLGRRPRLGLAALGRLGPSLARRRRAAAALRRLGATAVAAPGPRGAPAGPRRGPAAAPGRGPAGAGVPRPPARARGPARPPPLRAGVVALAAPTARRRRRRLLAAQKAQAGVAALLRRPARGDVGACGRVDGGGVERRVGALERVLAEAAAGLVEQAARGVDERGAGGLLAPGGVAQRPPVAAPGQQVLLRAGQRVPGVPQRAGLGGARPDAPGSPPRRRPTAWPAP